MRLFWLVVGLSVVTGSAHAAFIAQAPPGLQPVRFSIQDTTVDPCDHHVQTVLPTTFNSMTVVAPIYNFNGQLSAAGQGPNLVTPGITFQAGAGAFNLTYFDSDSSLPPTDTFLPGNPPCEPEVPFAPAGTLTAPGTDAIKLIFGVPVTALSFDIIGYLQDFADGLLPYEVDVYDDQGKLLDKTNVFYNTFANPPLFFGYQESVDIGSVDIFGSQPIAAPLIGDIMFGTVPEPAPIYILIVGLVAFGLTNAAAATGRRSSYRPSRSWGR